MSNNKLTGYADADAVKAALDAGTAAKTAVGDLTKTVNDLASKISNIGIAYVDATKEAIVYNNHTLVFAE